MKGVIFDIKEFSIHDGPGARTTVFLKGCPLRCKWCHNPEGLGGAPQLMYKESMCTHCGACRKSCSHPECADFGRCIHACPNGCLSVAGKTVRSAELAEKLLKDKELFERLNGGVTISGGEPMGQSEFVCDFAERMEGIHKAIQTSGYADFEVYRRVIDRFDYVMQDIKLADEAEHIKYTGVSNRKILENIEYLKKSGKQFIFRVPMIPGIVDTEENISKIKKIAGDFPIEFLKYNALAGAKYEMLGMEYPLQNEL